MKEEEFILTNSQKELKVKLDAFLKSSERIFRLIGKPGVGKTTMNKICLKDYINSDKDSQSKGADVNVVGITLSHRAKNVLGQHIPNVHTFASAYGLKEIYHDDGSRSFEYNKNQEDIPIGEYAIPVFVHDEVSQYTPEMLRIVLEKTPIFSKIIFMGDKAQLPPIDAEGKMGIDQDSPVFDLELPEECTHELTERVRQTKNNPILELSDVIREEIFGSQNVKRVLEVISQPKIHNEQGYSFVTYNQLNEHFAEKDLLETCLIAFRNKTINKFNINLRNYILETPEEDVIKGDIICMADNYYHKEGNEIMYVLHNSDVFEVDKVFTKNIKQRITYQGLKGQEAKDYKIEIYVGNIKGEHKQLFIPTPKGRNDLKIALDEIGQLCQQRKVRWDTFWNFKKRFCNCTYGYAITCYKAQGSGYRSVYVDINDILLTKPLTPKRKLQTIYTAITRASHDVYFLKGK